MLLDEEKKRVMVNGIIAVAKLLLARQGQRHTDEDTGFVHDDCHAGPFVMVEHQRQQLAGGTIKTNGLDLWRIQDGNARKLLCVNYIPYEIKLFDHAGRAPWIEEFKALADTLTS